MHRSVLTLLAIAGPGFSFAAGRPGLDFYYYYPNNTESEYLVDNTILVRTWMEKNAAAVTDPVSYGPPAITSVQLPQGQSFPPRNPRYWLQNDVYYVVIAGNATIGSLGDGEPMKSGDWVWAMAGVVHGPIVNAGSGNLTVYVLGTKLAPQRGAAPSFSNPTVNASHHRTRYCRYNDQGLGCDYSGPHTADRVTWSGVTSGKGYDPCASNPGHPMGSCLQPHYHPHGALYIGLSGRALYGQDYTDFDAWIDAGDVRWVRPGRWYGPEYTNDGCEILALHPSHGGSGDDSDKSAAWVSWNKPDDAPYVAQYTVTVSHVYQS